MTGVKALVEAILDGKLSCYPGSAYLLRYEDGQEEIVYYPRYAKRARPEKFEIIATARWNGEDCWTIYFNDQAVVTINTNIDVYD